MLSSWEKRAGKNASAKKDELLGCRVQKSNENGNIIIGALAKKHQCQDGQMKHGTKRDGKIEATKKEGFQSRWGISPGLINSSSIV